jgi:GNAT superfamily N-acetyltransferase
MNPGDVRELERVADLAYPAESVEVLDGWLLRMSGDLGRRVNSVAAVDAGVLPLDEKIDRAEAWYRDRGRIPMFKLTCASTPPHLDASLAGRGYRVDAAVAVVTLVVAPPATAPGDVALRSVPNHCWLEALQTFSGKSVERVAGLPDLIARAPGPAAYVWLADEGRVTGVALGVVVEGHLGVFEVFVDPACRGRGVGHRMMESLLAWGAGSGAQTAFLQVEERNLPARRFYRGLGFADAYRYWYRVPV